MKEILNEDDTGVIFCNQTTANKLIKQDPAIEEACIIWNIIDDNTGVVVSKEELVRWLKENGK